MIFKMFTGGPLHTNCYIVGDEKTRVCCLIDCAHGTFEEISQFIQEECLKLEMAILTHTHLDHIGDLKQVKEAFGPKILVHENDRKNLSLPGSDGIPVFIATDGVEADRLIHEGDRLHVGLLEIGVFETPGHSPGSVSLWIPAEKIIFTGDLIFRRGRGRTDLPGSCEEDLFRSIDKIVGLGDEQVIYSGHGKKTTIGEERSLYA